MDRALVSSATRFSRSRAVAHLPPAADAVAADLLSFGAARRWKEQLCDNLQSHRSLTCAGAATVRLHWAPGSRDLVPHLAEEQHTSLTSSHSPSTAKKEHVFVVADWLSSTFDSITTTSPSTTRLQWLRSPPPSTYRNAQYLREDALSPIRPGSVDCMSVAFGLKSFIACCGAGQGFEAAMEAASRSLRPNGRLHLLDFDRVFSQSLVPLQNTRHTDYQRHGSLLSSTLIQYAYYSPTSISPFPSIGLAVGRYRGDPTAEDRSVEQIVAVMEGAGFRDVAVEALSGGAAKLVSAVKGDCTTPMMRWRRSEAGFGLWASAAVAAGEEFVPGMAAKGINL